MDQYRPPQEQTKTPLPVDVKRATRWNAVQLVTSIAVLSIVAVVWLGVFYWVGRQQRLTIEEQQIALELLADEIEGHSEEHARLWQELDRLRERLQTTDEGVIGSKAEIKSVAAGLAAFKEEARGWAD